MKSKTHFSPNYLVDEKLVLDKGVKFQLVAQYRRGLKDWSISNGTDYRFVKNNKERMTVTCTKDCGFQVHALLINKEGVFQIKTWSLQHQCAIDWSNYLVKSR